MSAEEVTLAPKTIREHKPLVNRQVLAQRAAGFITAREAADIGGISVQRIYALVDEGKLVGRRVGSRRYLLRRSVLAYFNAA